MSISENVQKSILNKLQGYIIINPNDNENNEGGNDNDTVLTELEYDNSITLDELENFYMQSLSQCCNYCYLINFPTEVILVDGVETVVMDRQFEVAVVLWCAGLIWRKYDIRANDQIEETGNVISYGDQLIIDAKVQLKPFIYQLVKFW